MLKRLETEYAVSIMAKKAAKDQLPGAAAPAAPAKLSSKLLDMKFMKFGNEENEVETKSEAISDANVSIRTEADISLEPLFGSNESAWFWPAGLRPKSFGKPSKFRDEPISYNEIAAEQREQQTGRRSYHEEKPSGEQNEDHKELGKRSKPEPKRTSKKRKGERR